MKKIHKILLFISLLLLFFFSLYLYEGNYHSDQLNVNNEELQICGTNPMTGYDRSGYCYMDPSDRGTHTVCATMTDEFLDFTKSKGNDLSTPRSFFPGLKAGDNWCLCALRWKEAHKNGVAPPVILESTHNKTLQFVNLEQLK